MANLPTTPALVDPSPLDAALAEIQARLVAELPWLDEAYGKAEKLLKTDENGRTYYYPGVFVGGIEHFNVFPMDTAGAFSFFDVAPKQTIGLENRSSVASYGVKAGLVVCFDYRSVFPTDHQQRNAEHVKKQVLDALLRVRPRRSAIVVTETAEGAADVYPGYDVRHLEPKFLLRPYGAVRVNFDLIVHAGYC